MDFEEKLAAMASKAEQQKDQLQTEEATKNALIMPFISTVLGYDVFNPHEVIPEFTADVGIKKGEKIDYAIANKEGVQILIECKASNSALTLENASQLFRYFAVTNARIAILTNGVEYRFYTDLERPNRMDEKPFFVLNLRDVDETVIPELKKLTKESFDLDSIVSAAGELKYIGQIKRVLADQFAEPSDDWSRFLISRVYDGSITQKVRDQFEPLIRKAGRQFLSDRVNERLKQALGTSQQSTTDESPGVASIKSQEASTEHLGEEPDLVETTFEELEGYHIVRAIVCSVTSIDRVAARDTKSYFGVLLDDNNRKPIARLHFNRAQRYLGVFDGDKKETRLPIEWPEDIYLHAETLRETVQRYLN